MAVKRDKDPGFRGGPDRSAPSLRLTNIPRVDYYSESLFLLKSGG